MSRRRGLSRRPTTLDALTARLDGELGTLTQRSSRSGGVIQAASTLTVPNSVVLVEGSASVRRIESSVAPLYVLAKDGFTMLGDGGGNIKSDVVVGAGDTVILQRDGEGYWFAVGGGGPAVAGFVTNGTGMGSGGQIFKDKVGSILRFRSLVGSPDISVTEGPNEVSLAFTGSSGVAISNKRIVVGTGGGVAGYSGFEYDSATGVQTASTVNFKRPLVNVRYFGATGDGVTDDTDAIQAAIDYAETVAGTVFFPAGIYCLGKTGGTGLVAKSGVSYLGEGRGTVKLFWRPYASGAVQNIGGVILDTTGKNISQQCFQNMVLLKHGSVTAGVTGILGGSNTAGEYNSGTVTFRDLHLLYLQYGIRGNGRGYDPTGNAKIGFFDSLFDNVEYGGCEYGVLTGGSGNTHIKPFFIQCTKAAMVMDYISAESFSGEIVVSGTFTQNKHDVYYTNGGASSYYQYRPSLFSGTWFEASTHGIVGYDASVTGTVLLRRLSLTDCVMHTNAIAPAGYLFDGTKMEGLVLVEGCAVYKFGTSDVSILGGLQTRLMPIECVYSDASGVMHYIGTDASLHATKDTNQALPAGFNVITWTGADLDVESCLSGGTSYVVKYSGTYSVDVDVVLSDFADAATQVDIDIELNGTRVVFSTCGYQTLPHSIHTGGRLGCLVGDVIRVVAFVPFGKSALINVAPQGFPDKGFNTFKVSRTF